MHNIKITHAKIMIYVKTDFKKKGQIEKRNKKIKHVIPCALTCLHIDIYGAAISIIMGTRRSEIVLNRKIERRGALHLNTGLAVSLSNLRKYNSSI